MNYPCSNEVQSKIKQEPLYSQEVHPELRAESPTGGISVHRASAIKRELIDNSEIYNWEIPVDNAAGIKSQYGNDIVKNNSKSEDGELESSVDGSSLNLISSIKQEDRDEQYWEVSVNPKDVSVQEEKDFNAEAIDGIKQEPSCVDEELEEVIDYPVVVDGRLDTGYSTQQDDVPGHRSSPKASKSYCFQDSTLISKPSISKKTKRNSTSAKPRRKRKKPSGEKRYFCTECNYGCQFKSDLLRHSFKHTGYKPLICNQCDYKTSHKSHLTTHLLTHSGAKSFSCDQCDYKSGQKSHLTTHLLTHSEYKPFACNQCDYMSTRAGDMKSHQLKHSNLRPFACDQCDYKTKYCNLLKTHVLAHANLRQFSCDLCEYKANRSGCLKVHKLSHDALKPFICDQCDYRALHKSKLKIHKLTHTDQKPFSCDQCDYKSRQSTHLKVHKLIHTKDKPLSCDLCNYKTSRIANLQSHQAKHLKDKPFCCDLCDYTAKKATYVKRHKLKCHQTAASTKQL